MLTRRSLDWADRWTWGIHRYVVVNCFVAPIVFVVSGRRSTLRQCAHSLPLDRCVLTCRQPLGLILHVPLCLYVLSVDLCVWVSARSASMTPGSTWTSLGSHASARASLGGSSGLCGRRSSPPLPPAPSVCPLDILDTTASTLSVALHSPPRSPVPSAMSGGSVGLSGRRSSSPGVSTGSFDGLCGFVDSGGWSCDIVPGRELCSERSVCSSTSRTLSMC